jgi:hypothetical protein
MNNIAQIAPPPGRHWRRHPQRPPRGRGPRQFGPIPEHYNRPHDPGGLSEPYELGDVAGRGRHVRGGRHRRSADAGRGGRRSPVQTPTSGRPKTGDDLVEIAPVEASSGKNVRHQIYRGGDRHTNAALYRFVLVRMRFHAPTRAYVQRRTAQGRTKPEIIRCLKRCVAREIYNILQPATPTAAAAAA